MGLLALVPNKSCNLRADKLRSLMDVNREQLWDTKSNGKSFRHREWQSVRSSVSTTQKVFLSTVHKGFPPGDLLI
ncbi:unnamed protein product [Gongylonema pulchrum]|uniref:Ovule protein n=1 Tax=Gongylonema pulchrum TaxID=637853 RepID=A0A183DGC6_9BILA|nr:unnamed protein product [Gongylonema pulchrum]